MQQETLVLQAAQCSQVLQELLADLGTHWSLTGYSIAGTDFIGTTNNQGFVFKTNEIEKMRILSSGNVNIGTDSAQCLLHLTSIAPRVCFTDTNLPLSAANPN